MKTVEYFSKELGYKPGIVINTEKKETGENAILLLDDVMSELDYERQEFLVKSLSDNQLFITTTDIPEKITDKFYEGNIYKVKSGTVSIEEYIKEEEK